MSTFLTKSGINWNYESTGQGEAIVFIHGFGGSLQWWSKQKLFLEKDYQVICMDLPGHGQSSWLTMDLQKMASDLAEILRSLNLGQINLVASSFGGLIALELYRMISEQVSRISLVGSIPKFARTLSYPAGLDINMIRKLSQQFEGDYAAVLDMFFRSLFTLQERESPAFKEVKELRKTEGLPQKEALKAFLEILEKADLRDRLSMIICPVQLIVGEEDYICPKETMLWVQQHTLNARLDFINGGGHLPFLTKPEPYNELLENFLIN